MGNCIKRQSRTQWGGEDWGPAIAPPAEASKPASRAADLINCADPEPKSTEVKVKITKKQLEEVIKKMKMEIHEEGFTVQQVLEQLMKMSARYEAQQRVTSSPAWRPRLHTIPEFNSFHSSA